jgi:hypothetical protein
MNEFSFALNDNLVVTVVEKDYEAAMNRLPIYPEDRLEFIGSKPSAKSVSLVRFMKVPEYDRQD